MASRRPWLALALVVPAAVVLLASTGSAGSTTTFAPAVYVDQTLAGGEPTIFADSLHGR